MRRGECAIICKYIYFVKGLCTKRDSNTYYNTTPMYTCKLGTHAQGRVCHHMEVLNSYDFGPGTLHYIYFVIVHD